MTAIFARSNRPRPMCEQEESKTYRAPPPHGTAHSCDAVPSDFNCVRAMVKSGHDRKLVIATFGEKIGGGPCPGRPHRAALNRQNSASNRQNHYNKDRNLVRASPTSAESWHGFSGLRCSEVPPLETRCLRVATVQFAVLALSAPPGSEGVPAVRYFTSTSSMAS